MATGSISQTVICELFRVCSAGISNRIEFLRRTAVRIRKGVAYRRAPVLDEISH
jgi:hypothetical protein